MSSYRVAVVPDDAAPAAGTAIVRINGLTAWPDNATVRLVPIDTVAIPFNSEGWPWEPIKPQSVTVTDTGVDVVLGANVVASPRLLPGTPLIIKVGAANLEIEARWPAVVPAARRSTGAAGLTATQVLNAKFDREREERMAADRRRALADAAMQSARKTSPSEGEPAQAGRSLPLLRQIGATESAYSTSAATDTAAAEGSMGQLARLGPPSAAAIVPFLAPPPTTAVRQTGTLRGFFIGLATMAGAAALMILLAPPTWWLRSPVNPAPAAIGDQIAAVDLRAVFKDIADAGAQSPRKKAAANVDVATALSLADQNLRGPRTQADIEEAEFWLKRALASNMSGQEVGWALTQLGSIYATVGTPSHSYAKAHALWELAAAQGDPVAHCFLGRLYEHGLGVAKNRKTAREHYQTADARGACPGAKEAAARLSE